MKGRKPTPTLLANLHGRPTKTKPPPHEPRAITGDLSAAPDWMTDAQKAGWAYAIEHAPPGLLKRIDRGALTVWITSEDLHRQASIAQSKIGLLVKAPITGTPLQSPYLPIMNRQAQIMLKAASELGFSPVSRPRVGVMPSLPTIVSAESDYDPAAQPKRTLDDFLSQRPETQH